MKLKFLHQVIVVFALAFPADLVRALIMKDAPTFPNVAIIFLVATALLLVHTVVRRDLRRRAPLKFIKYMFSPGFTILFLNATVLTVLFSAAFLMLEKPLVAITMGICYVVILIACVLGNFFRWMRYKSYESDKSI